MDAGKDNINLAREKKHVKRLLKSLPESAETFMDVHGSLSRYEICHMSTTCVRPNSKIMWMQKNRYVKPDEFLNLQGLWPEDRPELANLAHESPMFTVRAAGEAMTTTVVQAKMLAVMLHSKGFRKRCYDMVPRGSESQLPDAQFCQHRHAESQPASSGVRPQQPNDGEPPKQSAPGTDLANSKAQRSNGGQPPKRKAPGRDLANSKIQRLNGGRPPKRRAPGRDLAKKAVVAKLQGESLQSGRPCRKRKRNKGGPDSGAEQLEFPVLSRGKKTCISIWAKMRYFQIFRTFQDDPSVRYPYAAFFKEPRHGRGGAVWRTCLFRDNSFCCVVELHAP